jgi:hypothetical protein
MPDGAAAVLACSGSAASVLQSTARETSPFHRCMTSSPDQHARAERLSRLAGRPAGFGRCAVRAVAAWPVVDSYDIAVFASLLVQRTMDQRA